ncbi:MAG: DUF2953 domain-containing protein [Clostridia bacterium]|nr:DUF2953 domain-containing protein [Clostridia bacterium]
MPIIALYILLGIALLIGLVLSIRGSINIVYEKELKIYLKVLFFKFWLFPERQVKFDPKKYQKMLKGEQSSPQAIIDEIKEDSKKNGLLQNIKMIANLVSSLLKTCAPHMRVKFAKLHIKVASSDAAKTAILYGAVSATAACLIDNIDEFTKLHKLKRKSVIIEPDFLSDRTEAKINISLSISVFGAIVTILKMMLTHSNILNKISVNNTPKGTNNGKRKQI